MQTSDRRVQIILWAIYRHPDKSMSELWDLALSKHGEGYGGSGRFNFGYVERTMPRLRKAGYIVKVARHRLQITDSGLAALDHGEGEWQSSPSGA